MLYEVASATWREIARVDSATMAGHYWSGDGKFLHFHTMPPSIAFYRVRVRDARLERMGTLQNARWVWGVDGPWMGVTPDGVPLFLRDQSVHRIYALDLNR